MKYTYIRYLLLASVFTFASMPLSAHSGDRQPYFIGRFCGYASAWVTSSFLVSRDFVKRELNEIKNRLSLFNTQILAANEKIEVVAETLNKVHKDQVCYNGAFGSISKAQILKLQKHKEALAVQKEAEEKLAKRIAEQEERTSKVKDDVSSALEVAKKAKQSVADERNAVAVQFDEMGGDLKKIKESIEAHYETRNNQLNSIMALSEVHRKNLMSLATDVEHGLEETRKRKEEQKKTSVSLMELEKYAVEHERKMNALGVVLNGFKAKSDASAGLPLMGLPGMPLSPFLDNNNRPLLSSCKMEDVD